MIGGVTHHIHVKRPLAKNRKKQQKDQSESSSRIANQNVPAKLASAELQIRRQRYIATIETVPYLIGACAFTGIHHSDIIVFKKLGFHPLTRLQQNSVKESWTRNIFLVNTRLVHWPQKPVLKAAFLFNTLKAIVDISMHI